MRQLDLFSAPRATFDARFSSTRRLELAHGAWVDHQVGWVAGHDALFEELRASVRWRTETMKMYDRVVDVPRLVGGLSDGDTTARHVVQALVATVSLGAPRRFLMRPADGGSSIPFALGSCSGRAGPRTTPDQRERVWSGA